ncbi:hypothetical protein QP185_08855 [Sphingomonas aerolata]|uniref:hypothetical protein n=1 Tax=Sphingomonas aerolata TaxID=185951 RepID=UPI002FE0627D
MERDIERHAEPPRIFRRVLHRRIDGELELGGIDRDRDRVDTDAIGDGTDGATLVCAAPAGVANPNPAASIPASPACIHFAVMIGKRPVSGASTGSRTVRHDRP